MEKALRSSHVLRRASLRALPTSLYAFQAESPYPAVFSPEGVLEAGAEPLSVNCGVKFTGVRKLLGFETRGRRSGF